METGNHTGFHDEKESVMESSATATQVATATVWAGQTPGEKLFSLTVFGLSTAVSVLFAYYLFTEPARLTALWEWTRSLPLLAQGLIWLLCLPWMAALWIWSSPWVFAVRLVLVVGILLFTEFLMYPFK
jgi:hypothetical protein